MSRCIEQSSNHVDSTVLDFARSWVLFIILVGARLGNISGCRMTYDKIFAQILHHKSLAFWLHIRRDEGGEVHVRISVHCEFVMDKLVSDTRWPTSQRLSRSRAIRTSPSLASHILGHHLQPRWNHIPRWMKSPAWNLA